uniref:Protein kinase domain n=1 Tax=Anatid alphaherpesvirus 2 TaxID=3080522 RepID=A0AAU0K740_9ALPH
MDDSSSQDQRYEDAVETQAECACGSCDDDERGGRRSGASSAPLYGADSEDKNGEESSDEDERPQELTRPLSGAAAIAALQYDILSVLTPGSEGSVYVCIRHGDATRTKVVVKVGNKGMTEKEVKVLRALNHSSIIKVLHAFRLRSWVCMAMPMYKCDLYTYIDTTALSTKQALRIEQCLLDALAYLHDCGIMHRDVKTENILLNNPEQACLADFGAACKMDAPHHVPKYYGWSGTLETNSPELLAMDPYNYKTDVWSAGLVLLEMAVKSMNLFGNRAHKGASAHLRSIIKTLQVHSVEFPKAPNSNLCRNFEQYASKTRVPYTVPNALRDFNMSADVEYAVCKMLTFDQDRRISAKEALALPLFTQQQQ